jgi:WD40 repeat protein
MLFPSLFVRVGLIAVLIVLIDAHVSSGDEPKPIKPVSTFTLSDTGTAVAFSPDGRTIAVGFEHGRIDLISTESGKPLFSLESKRYWPARMKFSDDGQTLFCKSGGGLFDGRCKFDAWRLKDRKLLTDSLRGADVADNADVIRDAGDGDLSPDGNTMLLGCYRTSMAAIDLVAGRIAHLNPEFPTLRPWPLSVEFFPDGKQIAIVARDFANDAGYSDDPDSLVVLSFPELRLKSSNPLNSRRRYRGLLAGKPIGVGYC